jgi:hypothetical protein
MLLWVGVSAAMFVVVAGWAWSLQHSLAVPPTATPPLGGIEDDFSRLYRDVTTSLDAIQPLPPASVSSPPAPSAVDPAVPPPAPVLTPDILEALQRELQERATAPPEPALTPTQP